MKTLTTILTPNMNIYLVQTLEDFEEAIVKEIGEDVHPDNFVLKSGYMMAEYKDIRIVYRKDGIFRSADFE